ncbi:site-specific tyrosine recombinase/integron integrase [Clostridium cochlearium]|uniref:site-specific tyrosine recombinase/integron integrase n=1 Tax=Clostridium cochlearium TaxID=1494 RepID=UPI000BBC5F01|nr:site-specific tyrosine recombinase/integron integrase [Clostridium cochlearium]
MLEEELIIKIIGKLSLEYPDINQHKVREILYECINNYEITARETALVASDIPDKAQMYLAIKKLDGLSEKTLYNYKLHLEKFADTIVKPVNMITTNDIRIYLAMLSRSKNLKQTTLGTEISILKSFFGWLFNEEYIEKNPMIKIKSPKKEKRLRKSLNVEELERLRDACKTLRERALLEFLFSTGCRLSELVSINISDIDWNTQSLRIIGKGKKERIIYFSPKAKLYLKKYLNSRIDNNTALFVASKMPYNRLGNRSVQREISKISKRAGFTKSIFPHLLRHTMATLALQSGAALTTVQKLLGHEDPGTTEIYAEISDENVKQEYRKYLIQ